MELIFAMFSAITFNISTSLGPDSRGLCQREALACVRNPFLPVVHGCAIDSDCSEGARCCYSGCVRSCKTPNPCHRVKCKSGYLCSVEQIKCTQQNCPVQATCLPEEQVRCPKLLCETSECPPGFKRQKRADGCQTCTCEPKKRCRGSCYIFCTYGKKIVDGCPICECNTPPEDPCANVECGPQQECRLLEVQCVRSPCVPVPTCVTKSAVNENACGFLDQTTFGKPVVRNYLAGTVNCNSSVCPDNTICTGTDAGLYFCCWQFTQEAVSPPMKPGECPPIYLVDFSTGFASCALDDDCPGNLRCCYRRQLPSNPSASGICLLPVHSIISDVRAMCLRSRLIRRIFSAIGLCSIGPTF